MGFSKAFLSELICSTQMCTSKIDQARIVQGIERRAAPHTLSGTSETITGIASDDWDQPWCSLNAEEPGEIFRLMNCNIEMS